VQTQGPMALAKGAEDIGIPEIHAC
jgi:hypothetical protein